MTVGRRGVASVLVITLVATVLSVIATASRLGGVSSGTTVPATGFQPAGVVVEPLEGASTPLRPGDIVTSVAERPITEWARTWLDPGDDVAVEMGASVPFGVERDGTAATVAVPVTAYPAGEVLGAALGTLSFVLAMVLIGAFVFVLRPAVPASGALLLAGVGAAGSTPPFLLGTDPLDLATGSFAVGSVVTSFVYLLLWAGLVDFTLVFPRPFGAVARRPTLRAVPYVAMAGGYAAALGAAAISEPSTLAWLGAWGTLSILPPVAAFAAIPLALAVRWRRAPLEDRRILRGFGVVMGFIVAANVVVWIVPEALGQEPLLPWTISAVTGLPFPVLVATAIVRHRAFDIDVVVRRSLVYGGLTLAVVAIYAITAAGLGAALGVGSGFASSLLATGVAAILALPLRDVLQRGVTRFVYGDRDEPVVAVRRLGERLSLVADPAVLPRVVVDTVAEAMRLPYVALELDGASAVGPVAQRGSPPPAPIARDLVFRGRTLGRLLVAPRHAGEPLSSADVRLLDDLCRQVAIAVDAARLTDDLRASRERIVTAREEERRRLRRDLHDGLGPALAGIGMRAEAAQALLGGRGDGVTGLLDELRAESAQAVAEIRRLVEGLRPPAIDELGLVAALRLAAERVRAPGTPDVVVEAAATLPPLPAAVEVAAYRIATEAVTNAVRHAAATTVRVSIEVGSDLTVVVEDDGRGVATDAGGGVGLASMHERAAELGGRCDVAPRPGGGTRVVARLPLPAPEASAS